MRTLAGFEYDTLLSVDAKQIRELAISRWIANGDSLLLGLPNMGKPHLAVAFGLEAIVSGCITLFRPTTSLVTPLVRAHAEWRMIGASLTAQYSGADLIVGRLSISQQH